MVDQQMLQMMEIRDKQKQNEKEAYDELYETSQEDLKRRAEMAQNDVSLNTGN